MRVHIVTDSVLRNTVEIKSIDAARNLFANAIVLDADTHEGRKGDAWNGSQFATPEAVPVVPQSVSRMQGLVALEMAGDLANLEEMMAAPATSKITRIAFENAQTFERNSPMLVTIAAACGMTDADIDALFIAAGKVVL